MSKLIAMRVIFCCPDNCKRQLKNGNKFIKAQKD